jgi:hypothetical protein
MGVRSGSFATEASVDSATNVRYGPNSDQALRRRDRSPWANSGHWHCIQYADYLAVVGGN